MIGQYAENDGRFPDEAHVEVRYPARLIDDEWVQAGALSRDEGGLDRDEWPWLPGTVLGQCGPDEWHVRVDVDELAEDDEDGQVDDDGEPVRWYPACFRDPSELRLATAGRGGVEAAGCEACRVVGPLLTAPGTSGRSWRCACGQVWPGGGAR